MTEARVVVINRTGEKVPTPMAIIGIPGGLEVRHDQLKELVKAGKIAAYEVLGRDLVLYWRAMEAEERVDLPISLVAAIPGNVHRPRQPRLPLLHRRGQDLDRRTSRGDHSSTGIA